MISLSMLLRAFYFNYLLTNKIIIMANLGKCWCNVKAIDKSRLKTLKSGAVGFNMSKAKAEPVEAEVEADVNPDLPF